MFTALGVCGGVALHDHATHIRESHAPIDIVVATPGRLLHLIERSAISLQSLRYLVMDEVDRMLSVEMEPQLREILRHSNAVKRQTLLWSATMPHFLDRLARSAVLNPIVVRVGMGSQHTGTTSSLHVTQRVVFMRAAEKKTKLLQVLRAIPRPPVLVFCNSHESVDFVTRVLLHEQFHVASLHGDKSQAYRFQVLAAFRDGYVDVLVATDLASRGLDFADVEHVIIFDMPHTIEDYVHRCGRTGRTRRLEHQQASSAQEDDRIPGVVTAFLTVDCEIATELLQLLRETKQQIPAELQVPGRFRQRHHA
uniref:RNA helicase n=1 Tax=Globisporangium ultimum (strain ATCC 200006 / CBS 805.95 / DAOM BR144) TaxID=431595 RepID=K3WQF6_GLOUD